MHAISARAATAPLGGTETGRASIRLTSRPVDPARAEGVRVHLPLLDGGDQAVILDAREMLRAPAGNPGTSGSDLQVSSGPGGWILFGALVLAGGSIYHFVSGVGTILKEIVHVADS